MEANSPFLLLKASNKTSDTDRTFSGFGTVEIYDQENEKISVDAVAKVMPILMNRGGIILDSHTNKPIGKILSWKQATNPETDEDGIYIKAKVFDDYSIDDDVWKDIRTGNYNGFSLGGRSLNERSTLDGGRLKTDIPDVEVWEFSVVREPCNSASVIDEVNFIAKGEKKKGFAGYKDFADCESKNQDKDDPAAYCAAIQQEAEGKTKQPEGSHTHDENNPEGLHTHQSNKSKLMEVKMSKDKKKQEEEETPPEGETPPEEGDKLEEVVTQIVEDVAALTEEVTKIGKRMKQIEEPAEEEEEDKQEDEKPPEEEEEKSKDRLDKKEIETIVKGAVTEAFKTLAKAKTPKPLDKEEDDELRKNTGGKGEFSMDTFGKVSWKQADKLAEGDPR